MSHSAGLANLISIGIIAILLSLCMAVSNPDPLSAAPSAQASSDLVADGVLRLESLSALLRQMHMCIPTPIRGVHVDYEPHNQNAWRPYVDISARGVRFTLISLKTGEPVTTSFGTHMVGTPTRDDPTPVLLVQPIASNDDSSGSPLPTEFVLSRESDAAAIETCFMDSIVTASRPIMPPRRATPDEMRARMTPCMPALPAPGTDEGLFDIFRVDISPPWYGGPNSAHSHHPDDLRLMLNFLRFTANSSPDMGWDAFERYQDSIFSCFLATSAL
jgi:hypothetical protein